MSPISCSYIRIEDLFADITALPIYTFLSAKHLARTHVKHSPRKRHDQSRNNTRTHACTHNRLYRLTHLDCFAAGAAEREKDARSTAIVKISRERERKRHEKKKKRPEGRPPSFRLSRILLIFFRQLNPFLVEWGEGGKRDRLYGISVLPGREREKEQRTSSID